VGRRAGHPLRTGLIARYPIFAKIDRNAQKTGNKSRFYGYPHIVEGISAQGKNIYTNINTFLKYLLIRNNPECHQVCHYIEERANIAGPDPIFSNAILSIRNMAAEES
jgi:hypothetical protein